MFLQRGLTVNAGCNFFALNFFAISVAFFALACGFFALACGFFALVFFATQTARVCPV